MTRVTGPGARRASRRSTCRFLFRILTILLTGCATRQPPASLFVPPPDLPVVAPRAVALPPGGCDGAPVRPGVALDCTGIAISYADSDYTALVEADVDLLAKSLAEERRGRLQDRALAEVLVEGARRRAEDAEREGRWLRVAAPVALVGGVVLGGAAAIGVLAAADQALATR